eukprot:TRINITY_DN3739_c0_g1_i1.p1 TRINITY_DN3739_c0_g1~~TRINITY_DN3739_c0_g1_i1.p1  ORF type:complete len:109 (-),score=28.54 TRINITY_DN3739_c0_g1_i1:161-487(-)
MMMMMMTMMGDDDNDRYTMFIVLYPTGTISEMGLLWNSLDYISEKQLFSVSLPNQANISFSFYWFVLVNLVIWFPGFLKMYRYMFIQRKKALSPSSSSSPSLTTKKLQ